MKRRRMVALTALVAATPLAGCGEPSGEGGEDEDGGGGEEPEDADGEGGDEEGEDDE